MTMSDFGGGNRRADSVAALVTQALLAHDLPDSTADEREAAGHYVDDSVAAMPDVTRVGVKVASAGVYAALTIMGGRPFRGVSADRRSELAVRLAGISLPILGEFNRLTRGLGLVGAIERRQQADGGGGSVSDLARPGGTTL